MSQKVTITQIAEIAGVSRGTVDKVIHNRPGVSEPVRGRVNRVLDELNYQPNVVARALKTAAKPLRIAVIIPRIDNPFFAQVKAGMEIACAARKDYGLQLEYFYSDNINLPELLSLLDYIGESGVDGIALRAMESGRLRAKIDEIAGKGIPIAVYDSDITGSAAFCFIGEDPIHSGRIAGSLMAKLLTPGGQVAVVGGSREFEAHRLREQGFTSALEARGLSPVERFDALEQGSIAYGQTAALLVRRPDLSGIFVVAGCATDVCRAVKEAGRPCRPHVICFNHSEESLPLIKDGTIPFAISTEPQKQGEYVVEALFDRLFHHREPKARHIVTPLVIHMDETV